MVLSLRRTRPLYLGHRSNSGPARASEDIAFFCSDRVLTVEGSLGAGDTTAAMGILSSRLRAKLFLSLWSSFGESICCSPRTPAAASGAGFGGAWPHQCGGFFFFWSVSSSSSGSAFFSPRAICYPQAHQQREWRLHYDLFGSGRGTSTLNLQIEFSWLRSAAVARVRRSKGLSCLD
jgi:hypothetical protein